jgi:hypothetical protein
MGRNVIGHVRAATAAIGAAATALALGAAVPQAIAASRPDAAALAASASAWKLVYKHHYGAPTAQNGFNTIVAPSRRQAWAFGGSDNFTGRPIAAHWTGGRWRPAPLPAGLTDEVDAVSASSPSNVWAVVRLGQAVLRWNGHRWSVAKSWHMSGEVQLTGVTALSPTDVWVFGSGGFAGGLGTWHYNGHTWKHLTRGAAVGIAMASAVSSSDMWAIGSLSAPLDSIVHYSHGRWQRVSAALVGHHEFNAILALSATNVWVIATPPTNQTITYLMHFNGHGWSRVRVPGTAAQDGQLVGLDADGHGGFWAVTARRILHRNAAGRWVRTQANTRHLSSLVRIPGTSDVLAPNAAPEPGSSTGSDAVVFENSRLG